MDNVSRYLQRLMPPGGHSHFGGSPGWRGGFDETALQQINDHCFSFDYMGAAEYEGGDVPRSLAHILSNIGKYELFHVEDYGSLDDIQWRPNEEPWEVGPLPPIFAFAPPKLKDYVISLVIKMWADPYSFKDDPSLQKIVKYPDQMRVIGWHDFRNHILLFVDGKICMDAIDFLKKNRKCDVGENWINT